ncbi:hypothetical protein Back11_30510 [Paenibacillus baekrokdamisoli]|uniref:NodB homology domain-containing protein n=2 Tax=Paenibacillus baekrokdamisoli TaxID=1712516 RepID=A0A3G9ITJ4_9BACL|nr:hypothetical protein Back11_30510 [Paenibacillus baekrokdamisoli]
MLSNRRLRQTILLLLAWSLLSISPHAAVADGKVEPSGHKLSSHADSLDSEPSFTAKQKKKKRQKRSRSRKQSNSWVNLQTQFPGIFVMGGPRNQRKVALTFDDVPDPRFTPQVLEILARYKVRATFFVVGSRAARHPDIVRRMQREGHIIGNHSYNHALFSRLSMTAFQQQIMKTERIIRPLAGYSPKMIRPPYGEILPKQVEWLKQNGYIVVNWDVDSADWRGLDSNRILINIKRTLQPGSIILQHAGGGKGQELNGTIAALPKLIQLLRSKGYTIVTLPELLGTPQSRQTNRSSK